MRLLFFILAVIVVVCFYSFLRRDLTERNTEKHNNGNTQESAIVTDIVTSKGENPKHTNTRCRTRRRNTIYFHKSKETGNIYPAEYWHMNNYIDFAVKGVNFSGNLSEYVGEFVGRLVAEPENEHDPNAISVRHKDGRHIGYVPKNLTQKVRDFKELPCDCYCYIERRRDDDGDHYFFALCYVTERPFGE